MAGRTKRSGCLLQVGDVLLMIGQLGVGLEELEVNRVVVFVEAPFADHVHRLAAS